MYKKKFISLALASLLPMVSHGLELETAATGQAAEATSAPAAETNAATAPAATAPAAAAENPAASGEESSTTEVTQAPAAEPAAKQAPAAASGETAPESSGYTAAGHHLSMEDRWKEREKHYQELRKRAEEAGVILPERPPWRDRPSMMEPPKDIQARMQEMEKMRAMTREELDAYRLQRYQEMRARAKELGMDLPETPPWKARQEKEDAEWAKQMEVIKGMTDEERAACHAMQRRHMWQAGRPGPMMSSPGMQRPQFQGQRPGYGYGYGPGPYGPGGDFWAPQR